MNQISTITEKPNYCSMSSLCLAQQESPVSSEKPHETDFGKWKYTPNKITEVSLKFFLGWFFLAVSNSLATETFKYYETFCNVETPGRSICYMAAIQKEMFAPAYHMMKELGSFGVAWRIAAWVGVSKILDTAIQQKIRGREPPSL